MRTVPRAGWRIALLVCLGAGVAPCAGQQPGTANSTGVPTSSARIPFPRFMSDMTPAASIT